MSEAPKKRGVLLGDWGHYGEVLREIEATGGEIGLVGKAGDDARPAAKPTFYFATFPPTSPSSRRGPTASRP